MSGPPSDLKFVYPEQQTAKKEEEDDKWLRRLEPDESADVVSDRKTPTKLYETASKPALMYVI